MLSRVKWARATNSMSNGTIRQRIGTPAEQSA
jgi:hypothetical protein